MTGSHNSSPASEKDLYALFARNNLAWSHHNHPPLFTVEQSIALRGDLPGAHVKNMFLKDKKDRLWLVTCLEHRRVRIRDLEKQVGAAKASFGNPDLLWDVLGLRPGAVSPLGLINDVGHRVTLILDRQMLDHDPINVHPLHNEATTAMPCADLMRFFQITGHDPLIVDFDALEALEFGRMAARAQVEPEAQ